MVKLLNRSLDFAADHVGDGLLALYATVAVAGFAVAAYVLLAA